LKKIILKILRALPLFLLFHFSICFADELIVEPDNGRAPLLNAIQHAQSSIDLSLYGFTDTPLMRAFKDAKNKGIDVRILLNAHPYKANHENDKAIQFFKMASIPLHWPGSQFQLLHQKTLLLDHQHAIVMTFNLTHSSFATERNFALLITDPAMVQEIQRVFDADWEQKKINVENPDLVWSPDNSRKKILALIQQAQSDIEIYTQTISDYEIIGALAKAAHSNIKVDILLSMPPAKRRLNYLTQAGVNVHISQDYFIHAKVLIIDQKRAMLGSINLTKASLDKNRELSVITDDTKIVHQLSKLFNHDFA
jgi:phosphatidylserine/phosphatidylglycerophosphate/cardiolipin synthase-like enzyme